MGLGPLLEVFAWKARDFGSHNWDINGSRQGLYVQLDAEHVLYAVTPDDQRPDKKLVGPHIHPLPREAPCSHTKMAGRSRLPQTPPPARFPRPNTGLGGPRMPQVGLGRSSRRNEAQPEWPPAAHRLSHRPRHVFLDQDQRSPRRHAVGRQYPDSPQHRGRCPNVQRLETRTNRGQSDRSLGLPGVTSLPNRHPGSDLGVFLATSSPWLPIGSPRFVLVSIVHSAQPNRAVNGYVSSIPRVEKDVKLECSPWSSAPRHR